jgi:hypothetical protein
MMGVALALICACSILPPQENKPKALAEANRGVNSISSVYVSL